MVSLQVILSLTCTRLHMCTRIHGMLAVSFNTYILVWQTQARSTHAQNKPAAQIHQKMYEHISITNDTGSWNCCCCWSMGCMYGWENRHTEDEGGGESEVQIWESLVAGEQVRGRRKEFWGTKAKDNVSAREWFEGCSLNSLKAQSRNTRHTGEMYRRLLHLLLRGLLDQRSRSGGRGVKIWESSVTEGIWPTQGIPTEKGAQQRGKADRDWYAAQSWIESKCHRTSTCCCTGPGCCCWLAFVAPGLGSVPTFGPPLALAARAALRSAAAVRGAIVSIGSRGAITDRGNESRPLAVIWPQEVKS